MTTNVNDTIERYTISGAGPYAFSFRIFDSTELSVSVIAPAGVDSTLLLSSQYTVTGVDDVDGGSITLTAGTVTTYTGYTLDIRSNTQLDQPTSIKNQGSYRPIIHETAFDRLSRQLQDVYRQLKQSFRYPDDVVADAKMTNRTSWLGKYPYINTSGVIEPATALTGGTLSQSTFDALLPTTTAQLPNQQVKYLQTPAEIAASVTPTAYNYPELDINRYGSFAGDNSHDDTAAWNNAIAVATQKGGGIIRGLKGRTSKTTATIVGAQNVIIDLEGGTINANLVGTGGNDYGAFKYTSLFHVCNGSINVISTGSVGAQSGIHAAINIGPLYGDGGTSIAVSPFEGIYGWSCRNLTLHTNRAGKVCIQIMGGANNGVIDHIRCPDSSTVAGVVHADWGTVGTIVSAAASMGANKTAFLAGTAWTTHPNAISITNIKAGNLTYNAANVGDCIRLSGVHGISIDTVEVDGTTNAGFYHTASDVGYEFAPTAIKPYAHRGITVKNFNVKNANNGWGFFNDTWADNVTAAISGFAYVPIIDPYGETDLTFERCFTTAGGGASVLPGFRIQNTRGTNVIDCEATGHLWGGIIDTVGHKVHVIRGRYWKNRNDGWAIGKSVSTAPQDCVLEDVFCDQNGQDGGYSPNAGIYIQSCVRLKIIRGKTGADGLVTEATQQRGIWIVDTTAVNVSIKDHYVNAVKAAGFAYVVSSSTDYGILDVFSGNRADSGVSNFWAGVNIIPTLVEYGVDGIERRIFRCARASLTSSTTPTAGTWKLGDTIYYSDPITADFIGTTCTAAGSPGTWKRFGATT